MGWWQGRVLSSAPRAVTPERFSSWRRAQETNSWGRCWHQAPPNFFSRPHRQTEKRQQQDHTSGIQLLHRQVLAQHAYSAGEFVRCAQVVAARLATGECSCASPDALGLFSFPGLAGVSEARYLLFAAETRWKRVRLTPGLRSRAASLAMKSKGSEFTRSVPSPNGGTRVLLRLDPAELKFVII